jgi:hypothetical protein
MMIHKPTLFATAMKKYPENCQVCNLIRSMAFTTLGMGIGITAAYFLGASKQNMIYSGITVAAMFVFGRLGKRQ